MNVHIPRRAAWAITAMLALGGVTQAQPLAAETPEAQFQRRIGTRTANLLSHLKLENDAAAESVRRAALQFYRGLHVVHTARDAGLARVPPGEVARIHRVNFDADQQAGEALGRFVAALAAAFDDRQVEAVKDWMTFDMVALSVAEYDRMFPRMTARQRAQLRAWLIESRERSLIAGSSETKLDVFRVNKSRMHAYLAAQGYDVETAVNAEAARKRADNRSG